MRKRFIINASALDDGGIRCDVWGDGCEMYPELWNNKFYGYSMREIKEHIREKLEKKYNCKIIIAK